jgi:hypothetical protein
MLYWHSFKCSRFRFKIEILVNCLFTKGKWTLILNFEPSRWNALNMGFVDKRSSRMQGRFFLNRAGWRQLLVKIKEIKKLAELPGGAESWPPALTPPSPMTGPWPSQMTGTLALTLILLQTWRRISWVIDYGRLCSSRLVLFTCHDSISCPHNMGMSVGHKRLM